MWVAMLVLAGFFIGGMISFARSKRWGVVVLLGFGVFLSVASALAWAPRA